MPWSEVENGLWSLCYSIPPTCGKQLVTVYSGLSPIGVFPVGASFLIVGTMKGLVLIGPKTLIVFRGAFLRRNSYPSLTIVETGRKERAKRDV